MKKINFSLLFFVLFLNMAFKYSNGQTNANILQTCGYSKAYVQDANSPANLNALQNASSSLLTSRTSTLAYSPYMVCGRFEFIFEDVLLQTGVGFDDHANSVGSAWAECLYNVGAYVQSIFDVPAGDGSYIEIFVKRSWTASSPPSDPNILAAASPLYSSSAFNANQPGFYGGNMYEHMTTGNDPDVLQYDAVMTFNTNYNFLLCYENYSCNEHDFYSVALHELTHAMGWASLIEENSSTFLPNPMYGNNKFSIYDREFLFTGDILNGPFLKIVNNSNPLNPFVNNGLQPHVLTNGNVWYTDKLAMTATTNQNDKVNYGPNSYNATNAPNTISHFFNNQVSFGAAAYISPQFSKNFVMKPAFALGQLSREYTKTELRYLHQMGYVFKPFFLSQSTINTSFTNSSIISNIEPYTTRPLFRNWPEFLYYDQGFPVVSYYYSGGMDNPTATIADAQISNCQIYTLDLSAHTNELKDADGDPLFIYPGSLYNIRGCGNNGNDHLGLAVTTSTAGDIITYTPRPDFIGRAQFGFHLYDGKEKGAFVVYTIDVSGCHAPAANMVVNGNFEQGEEIQTMTSSVIDNVAIVNYYLNKKYPFNMAQIQADGMVYQNGTTVMVREAVGCNVAATGINNLINAQCSFENGDGPIAPFTQFGNRYLKFQSYGDDYFRLNAPVSTCQKYKLEFDYNEVTPKSLVIGFTNLPEQHKQTQQFDAPLSYTLPATSGTWQHILIPVNYCAATQDNWLVINSQTIGGDLYIDNLSLTADNTPHTFSVNSITTQTICTGLSATLAAVANSPFCSVTYTWLPGAQNTSSVTVTPAATSIYTVLANDGCASYSTTATVFVKQGPNISVSASQTICAGETLTLFAQNSNTAAVTQYTWMPGNYNGASVSVSPGVTTEYTVIASDNSGCFGIGQAITDVYIAPPLSIHILSPGSVCATTPVTLTAYGAVNYTWTSASGMIAASNANTNPLSLVLGSSPVTFSVTGSDINGCKGTATTLINITPTQQCVCINTAPEIQWQTSLGGTNYDVGLAIASTTDGGNVIAGLTGSNDGDVSLNHGNTDYWLVKLNSSGSMQWEKTYGGVGSEEPNSVKQTADGGFIMAGFAGGNGGDITGNHGGNDYWIVKTDATGNILWEKSLGGSGDEQAKCVSQTNDGGYIVCGISASNNLDVSGNHGNSDYWVVKLDQNGTIQWQKSLGGSGMDQARFIEQTADGGYIVCGGTSSNDGDVTNNHGSYDYWLVKLSNTGTIQWQKAFGGTGVDIAYAVRQTPDGGYIAGGSATSTNNGNITGAHGGLDFWAVKVDAGGNLVWQKMLGGVSDDELYSIQQTDDGGYVMGGFSETNSGDITGNHGGFDFWLLKLNANGSLIWEKSLGGSQNDNGTFALQTADGDYLMTGATFSNDGNVSGYHGSEDAWLVKLKCNTVTTGVDAIYESMTDVEVYPNPMTDHLYVEVDETWIGSTFILTDQLGRIIKTGKLNGQAEVIYVDDLPDGMYFLRLNGPVAKTTKIVKCTE